MPAWVWALIGAAVATALILFALIKFLGSLPWPWL